MKIIVQKFGGTSVADADGWRCLCAKVKQSVESGWAPVVVVSAMGRYPQPYATDSLLSLVKQYEAVGSGRERDLLMSCGELISAVVISHYLRSQGLEATAVSGAQAGIYTDDCFNEACIQAVNAHYLLEVLRQGKIPVVAGFQGLSPQGDVVTLGRGGSDTTAVALGAALQAERVEIFSDVEGIMTADPRILPQAKVLDRITCLEIGEMAQEGAKVLHPRAVSMAKNHRVKLVVRSTFSDAPGTEVLVEGLDGNCSSAVSGQLLSSDNRMLGSNSSNVSSAETTPLCDRVAGRGQVATGIVTVPARCAINVDLAWVNDFQSARLEVLDTMASHMVSLDMIDVVGNHLYFLINQGDLLEARELLRGLGYGFTVRQHVAKVSVVGYNMRGVPGVMWRICRALAQAHTNLLYATDSHITISCVVPEEQLQVAAQALHSEFALEGI